MKNALIAILVVMLASTIVLCFAYKARLQNLNAYIQKVEKGTK